MWPLDKHVARVALGKGLTRFEPQFIHLYNRDNNTYASGPLRKNKDTTQSKVS